MMSHIPEEEEGEDKTKWNSQAVICMGLLNASRSVSRGTETANRAAISNRAQLTNQKQWLTQGNFRKMIHKSTQVSSQSNLSKISKSIVN